ncbi:hypothetical protein ILYODFUR_003826 [Ilyodon furcidens]|uniref:Uncharacterized protein n=1 Tax=Ilyodon furcidens TaxID=33524 RepID=A0ABV0UZZ7_9TELE
MLGRQLCEPEGHGSGKEGLLVAVRGKAAEPRRGERVNIHDRGLLGLPEALLMHDGVELTEQGHAATLHLLGCLNCPSMRCPDSITFHGLGGGAQMGGRNGGGGECTQKVTLNLPAD